MKPLLRTALVMSFALSAGCSTITGWFSDDDFDPREPVELQKIDEQVKLKSRWPATLEFDLLVDFLQFNGFTRIEIIVTEPSRNRATACTERKAHHQCCAQERLHQLASSSTSASSAGKRVSSVRTLLSSTTLY